MTIIKKADAQYDLWLPVTKRLLIVSHPQVICSLVFIPVDFIVSFVLGLFKRQTLDNNVLNCLSILNPNLKYCNLIGQSLSPGKNAAI